MDVMYADIAGANIGPYERKVKRQVASQRTQ
jgi:hypothetical protein